MSVPFGIMCGYVLASLVLESAKGSSECFGVLCWRLPFIVQVCLVFPLCVAFNLLPSELVRIQQSPGLGAAGGGVSNRTVTRDTKSWHLRWTRRRSPSTASAVSAVGELRSGIGGTCTEDAEEASGNLSLEGRGGGMSPQGWQYDDDDADGAAAASTSSSMGNPLSCTSSGDSRWVQADDLLSVASSSAKDPDTGAHFNLRKVVGTLVTLRSFCKKKNPCVFFSFAPLSSHQSTPLRRTHQPCSRCLGSVHPLQLPCT